ncbi:hypothetical protein VTJ04DRAFT_1808 [Mycothermus thermophilus]|uniref:uncharacterized protein n=1 Tax=Humicola insolens TaxID=85995 RepID=UPI0037446D6B
MFIEVRCVGQQHLGAGIHDDGEESFMIPKFKSGPCGLPVSPESIHLPNPTGPDAPRPRFDPYPERNCLSHHARPPAVSNIITLGARGELGFRSVFSCVPFVSLSLSVWVPFLGLLEI